MFTANNTVYFWKPQEGHGYLSQWYFSRFVSTDQDGEEMAYQDCEQYMMHGKGLLFAPDSSVTATILQATRPAEIRSLGRKVPNFKEDVWKQERYRIVVQGNYLKFSQDEELKKMLLGTGESELVEASPYDKIWGIGYKEGDAPRNRSQWGANLLGKALMEVRKRLRNEMDEDEKERRENGKEEKATA